MTLITKVHIYLNNILWWWKSFVKRRKQMSWFPFYFMLFNNPLAWKLTFHSCWYSCIFWWYVLLAPRLVFHLVHNHRILHIQEWGDIKSPSFPRGKKWIFRIFKIVTNFASDIGTTVPMEVQLKCLLAFLENGTMIQFQQYLAKVHK